jgi:hypothetical protein
MTVPAEDSQTYAASSNNSASSLQGSSFAAAVGIVGVLLM